MIKPIANDKDTLEIVGGYSGISGTESPEIDEIADDLIEKFETKIFRLKKLYD